MRSPSNPPRTKLIAGLVTLVGIAGAFAAYHVLIMPPQYSPKYRTVAHRFLDLEGKYASVPDGCYPLLDEIITEVKSTAPFDPAITDPEARSKQITSLFNTIDSILTEKNFVFPTRWNSTLGEALEGHTLGAEELAAAANLPHNARRASHMREHASDDFHLIACLPNAFLYMGIAEAMGLELRPVLVPEHIFVRAEIDAAHHINWDANRGRVIGDAEYIRDWGVTERQIAQKVYMQPLSPGEIEGQMYRAVGAQVDEQSTFRGSSESRECFRMACRLSPNDLYASASLANSLLFSPAPDAEAQTEAFELARRAVEIQPREGGLHMTLAFAWAAAGNTDNAALEARRAAKEDPDKEWITSMVPWMERGYTMYAAYKSREPIKYWIGYEHGWLVLLTGFAVMVIGGIALIARRVSGRAAPENVALPSLMPAMQ